MSDKPSAHRRDRKTHATVRKCSGCGTDLNVRFPKVRDPVTNETFAIYACAECGLGHTIPRPRDLGRYYGGVYYGNRHGITAGFCTRRRLGLVTAAMTEGTGRRLLDVGCGDGAFLLAARDAGWTVLGTERHPDLARAAGLDVRERIEQAADAAPFDCVTMWHTLEHMPDIGSTLSRVSDLLSPRGMLIVAVPDNGGLQARVFKHKWLHLDVPRHLYHFDAGSLASCLRRTGFTPRKRWHQEFEYDLLGWSQSALNWVFPVPNVFFDALTGKDRHVGTRLKISNALLSAILTTLAIPAVGAGTVLGRGGTLIVAASR